MNYQFSLNLTVRDYECDLQGIVNNAVYLNYLEHTRHQFLLGHNIDFAKLHREGIDPVSYTHLDVYKRQLHIQSIPANYLIDNKGVVIGKNLTPKELNELLQKLLP